MARSRVSIMSSRVLLLIVAVAALVSACAADPEPVQDFCVAAATNGSADHPSYPGFPCKPASAVVSDDFFFAGLARSGAADAAESPFGSSVTSGNVAAFPGLNTLGVSINRVDLAPGGVNPLHSHPRAAELVHVVSGQMLVGFVSTAGTFYSKVVREGESFVIPRGMVHFQFNTGKESARAVTVFNSQLPGVVLAAPSLFGADPEIPDAVLSKSFQVDGEIIKLLKSKFRT
ncbi:germin-like protein 3-7 [Triticum dicoccoides]|uniref:germin-like protein 3-7 n=1 Tax=Triticum dicoccoides TaxID=85692 RepID=UPI00016EEF0B|nr:germin-like protein 3-7 [Triticum dicoccoides]